MESAEQGLQGLEVSLRVSPDRKLVEVDVDPTWRKLCDFRLRLILGLSFSKFDNAQGLEC